MIILDSGFIESIGNAFRSIIETFVFTTNELMSYIVSEPWLWIPMTIILVLSIAVFVYFIFKKRGTKNEENT